MMMIIAMVSIPFADSFQTTAPVTTSSSVEISYKEYIQQLAKAKKMTIAEAMVFNQAENVKYEASLKKRIANGSLPVMAISRAGSTGTYTYKTYKTIKACPVRTNCKASASITLKIYNLGSFREFVGKQGEVNSKCEQGADGGVDFISTNLWSDPAAGTGTRVNYCAEGYFECRTTTQLTTGLGAVFQFVGTFGSTYVYRSATMSIMGTASLY